MVLKIAHQVDVIGTFPGACGNHLPIYIPLQKMRMALYRILPFIPFPTPPGIVPRRPPRHASAHHGPVVGQ
jgi:hypothetical protein